MSYIDDFVASVCDGFTNYLYMATGELFCRQDSYEVLIAVFGRQFAEADLRNATSQQYEELAIALRDILELPEATSSMSKAAVKHAILQWSGY